MAASSAIIISYFLFCLLLLAGDVDGVRVKIQLQSDNPSLYAKQLRTNGSCSDMIQVNRSSLTLYGNLKRLGKEVKFWKSDTATENLAVFESMKVPGLKGQTVAEVFNALRKGNCYPYFLGGSVRDQFLNRIPNDADVEVDCSMATFVKLCIEKWGMQNCQSSPGSHVAHIGNTTVDKDLEVMDIGTTNSTFYVPVYKLEYTVNSMAYDTNGNSVIIDLTGTGAQDACDHHIRIPSSDNSLFSWNLWLNNTQDVLYRFWKLRAKGLVAFNNATQKFVVKNAEEEMQAQPQSFAKFYCHYVFNSKYDQSKNKCMVDPAKCERGLMNAILYERVLSEDLGDYWSKVMVENYLPNLSDCTPTTVEFHSHSVGQ